MNQTGSGNSEICAGLGSMVLVASGTTNGNKLPFPQFVAVPREKRFIPPSLITPSCPAFQ